jgi:replicative DNA helicase
LGSLVTVGGEVGAGKSRFLLNLALGYARRGLRVAIMLGEMDEKQSLRRAVCALAEVPFKALRNPTEEQQGKLEKAREQLERLENLEFVRPGAGLSEMREWAAWAQILFLDPLQTMADGYPQPAEHERITALMRELVALCAEGLVVFASSEIGQGNGEERDVGTAFKGSGSIKQYSTALYFGLQPDEQRVQVFKCFKQREGEKVPLKVQIRPGWQGIAFLPKPSKGGEDE